MRAYVFWVLGAAVCLCMPRAWGEILNVPADYPTIQEAIDAAVDGDEVVLAPGVYRPGFGVAQSGLIIFGKAITLRSSDPNDSGIVASTIVGSLASGGQEVSLTVNAGEGRGTIIDGITIANINDETPLQISNASGPTVRNCVFTARTNPAVTVADNSTPLFQNCIFDPGHESFGDSDNLVLIDNSSVEFHGCTVIASLAPIGVVNGSQFSFCDSTVISSQFLASSDSDVSFVNSHILGVTESDIAGGDLVIDSCAFQDFGIGSGSSLSLLRISADNALIRETIFDGLRTRDSSGVVDIVGSSVEIEDSIFSNNFHGTQSQGGAISQFGGSLSVSRTSFLRNDAGGGGAGGAIAANNCDLTVVDSLFDGNRGGSRGGAIWVASGTLELHRSEFIGNFGTDTIYVLGNIESTLLIDQCEFLANHTRSGYVINLRGGSFRVIGSLILKNFGSNLVFAQPNDMEIANCIIAGNESQTIIHAPGANPGVHHCVIEGGWAGNGFDNIDAVPIFMRAPNGGDDGLGDNFFTSEIDESLNDDYGDLRPAPNSPVIDAGDNTAVVPDVNDLDNDGDTTEPVPFDLNGDPRFRDDTNIADTGISGAGYTQVVDIGPYEFQGTSPDPCLADVTSANAPVGTPGYGTPDGAATASDLQFFVNAWIGGDIAVADITTANAAPGEPGFATPDGLVTASDLQLFVNLWLAGCP